MRLPFFWHRTKIVEKSLRWPEIVCDGGPLLPEQGVRGINYNDDYSGCRLGIPVFR